MGLKNYVRLFKDPYVVDSLKNTLLYTVMVVPLQTIFSMTVAALIAAKFRNRFGRFVKGMMFVPVISSTVLVGTLWSVMLATDGGIINAFLGWFGASPINWLGSSKTALLGVCAAAIWKNVGYFLVIFYAGIMNIPGHLYEAAEVDGASYMQSFFHITLPSLKPITFMVMTLGMIWSFQVFDLVYTMTNGGPGRSTKTLVLTIYNAAFKERNMGFASAVAVLMFCIVMIVSAIQKFCFGEKGEKE
ncbi:MAG: sugar ABC transporter permease [Ruthenibacterium sp.]